MSNWTDRLGQRFDRWFNAQDLGECEQYRHTIRAFAMDNAAELSSIEVLQCAKSTVAMYLDQPEMREGWDPDSSPEGWYNEDV